MPVAINPVKSEVRGITGRTEETFWMYKQFDFMRYGTYSYSAKESGMIRMSDSDGWEMISFHKYLSST